LVAFYTGNESELKLQVLGIFLTKIDVTNTKNGTIEYCTTFETKALCKIADKNKRGLIYTFIILLISYHVISDGSC
jgi:hypothetical protein